MHFTPELEPLARRAAAQRRARLGAARRRAAAAPRAVDLVVSDDVDLTNGYGPTFHQPHRRLRAHRRGTMRPALLRRLEPLVVTHELAHIFHLDRSGGWWRVAQRVFGRSPFLFPNQYLPAWVTEGLAVYYESRLTGSGRVAGTHHRALAASAARAGTLPGFGSVSLASTRFPGGEAAYAYGGLFIDYLSRTRGDSTVANYVNTVAGSPIPFLLDRDARAASASRSRARGARGATSLAAGARDNGRRGVRAAHRRHVAGAGAALVADTLLVAGLNTGREVPRVLLALAAARLRRLGRATTPRQRAAALWRPAVRAARRRGPVPAAHGLYVRAVVTGA